MNWGSWFSERQWFIVANMNTRGKIADQQNFGNEALHKAFQSLAIRLQENRACPVEIVVCGGAALILTGLVARTTKDVDVVALSTSKVLQSPDPLPDDLLRAVVEAAEDMGVTENWLNNGPSSGEGGLFQMGLPAGLERRLCSRKYGPILTVHLIGRLDQIYFKLFAAADRGGYHIEDLLALEPEPDEISGAAMWAMSHDVSVGFATILKNLLGKIGYCDVADRL